MWGFSLTYPLLLYVESFSYTLHTVWCGEFLLHAPCCFMCGVSLTCSILFDVGNYSYTPLAVLRAEFLLHALCCFMWGVFLTYPVLFYVGSFSFTPLAVLCGESYSTLMKDAEKESKSLEKRDNGKVCGLQRGTALLTYTAAHDTGFVGTQMASMGPSARSGHSHRWPGKYGPIGGQGRLTHRVWLRLSIGSLGSEQTGPFPCICLKLWAQEICVVCTFQCPNIALPRTTLGLCTASWPDLTIQAVVGSPSYTRPS